MVEFRLIARSGDRVRSISMEMPAQPTVGLTVNFDKELGEQVVTSATFDQTPGLVTVDVTPEKFAELKMVIGWSAVE